ncbi:MAG: type II toxin-antitoxin system RelE/ParE family toxin, partial [Prochlorococcaceae cyanobacterium]
TGRQLLRRTRSAAKRLATYLQHVAADPEGPRRRGKPLTGGLSGLWRYRVGDYRVICELIDLDAFKREGPP